MNKASTSFRVTTTEAEHVRRHLRNLRRPLAIGEWAFGLTEHLDTAHHLVEPRFVAVIDDELPEILDLVDDPGAGAQTFDGSSILVVQWIDEPFPSLSGKERANEIAALLRRCAEAYKDAEQSGEN